MKKVLKTSVLANKKISEKVLKTSVLANKKKIKIMKKRIKKERR